MQQSAWINPIAFTDILSFTYTFKFASFKVTDNSLVHVYVVVQFYLWFKILKTSLIWIYHNMIQREKDQTA